MTEQVMDKTTWLTGRLIANPLNPRGPIDPATVEDLAASMRTHGVVQPLVITPKGWVVAGHRRLAAAKVAGLDVVPVIVRDLTPQQQQEIMLIENLQRQDLSVIEEAKAYQKLLDDNHVTTADLARRVGIAPSRIHQRVLLLKLDGQVQVMFHRGDLPVTLAPILAKVKDHARQRQVAVMAANRRLTVQELERIVERGAGVLGTPPPPPPEDAPTRGRPRADAADAQSPGRAAVLAKLEALNGKNLSTSELAKAFKDVCCACGMSDLPEYCAACPMVQLVEIVVSKAGG